MNLVQPIRSRELVDELGRVLRAKNEKYYVMYRIGLTSGLRISDILKITAGDVKRDYINTFEVKTGKRKFFKLNSRTKKLCLDWIEANDLKDSDYVVFSHKHRKHKMITRQQAHNILKEGSNKLGMEDVGTHTLRKTFGYWHYKQYRDVVILQQIFNHSSPSMTLRYIGITQNVIDRTVEELDL